MILSQAKTHEYSDTGRNVKDFKITIKKVFKL